MPNTWFPSNGVSRRLFIAALAALLAFTALVVVPGSVPAARSASHPGTVPPGFPEACGLDFLVILDESGSIRTAGAIDDITGAFDTLVTSLMGTGSRIYAMDFNSNANPWGNGWVDTIPGNQATFDTYIGAYNPPGSPAYWTNWEDAFRVADSSGVAATADVVMFITDGNPTATVDRSVIDASEYETDWPLGVPGDVNIDVANATAYAAANVDAHPDGGSPVAQRVKSSSYVWGIGVGDAFGDPTAQARLAGVSDAATLVDFEDLGDVLRQAVFSNCENSLKLSKTVTPPQGPAIPGEGYDFDVAVTVNGSATTVTPSSDTTDASGDAGPYEWTTESESDVAVITVTETGVGDTGAVLTGAACTWQIPGSSGDATVSFTPGDDFFVITDIPSNSLVNCDVENEVPVVPALGIVKSSGTTSISSPQTIDYTVVVSNEGNVTLTGVTVDDPMLGGDITDSCNWPVDGTLAVGESTTCSGSYDATQGDVDAGDDIVNTATANSTQTGEVTDDHIVTVTQEPSIDLSKVGEFNDESGDGFAQPGETISYTFAVQNNGNVTLYNVDITDLVGGITVVGGPIASLAPGASDATTFTASYAVTQDDIDAGTFLNVAIVCGLESEGDFATQADGHTAICAEDDHEEPLPQNPTIDIVKDADPGTITGGIATEVTWTIKVTNTGNVTLQDVAVTDALEPGCDLVIGSLAVGAVSEYTCTSTLTPDVESWTFTNVAVVDGEGPLGTPVSATDNAIVLPVFVAASATIGDTVWNDENENGIQDNGEKGIAGAKVRLTLPDATTVETTTNASGLYLFSALEAGEYKVELITSSIPPPSDGDNKLTTAGSFTIQLLDDQAYLDADFGITATLPVTGISADSLALIALASMLLGGVAILATRRRQA